MFAMIKSALAGNLGCDINLGNCFSLASNDATILFSESYGRVIVTIAKENKDAFENLLRGTMYAKIGKVVKEKVSIIGLDQKQKVDISLDEIKTLL